MKITVAIPVYNTEQYLDRCLNSISNQSFKEFEIIIVNDSSPNNYHNKSIKDITESYNIKELSMINHIDNKGLFQARLTGLKNSKAEYICFVDSDDWLEKTYLEDLYKSITKNNADISISNFYYSKTNRNKIKSTANLTNNKRYINNHIEVTNMIYKEEIRHCIWNKLYKKEILIKSNILHIKDRINQSEDLLFNSYAFLEAKSISMVNKPLYNYFLNTKSMTNDFSLSTFQNRIDSINIVMKNIKELLINKDIYTNYKDDYKSRYIQQSYYLISILQRANLNEDKYFKGFEYLLNNINNEYVIKSLNRSPVIKIANIIENKILPPLTFRRYLTHIIYNKMKRIFKKNKS